MPDKPLNPRATISDVARLAGVSKVTVSYVLNGRGREARISEATSKKVRKAAAELQYSPNVIAQSMVTGKIDTLGVVFQHADYFADRSDFTMDLMHGVTTGALKSCYNLMLHTKPVRDAQAEASELLNGSVSGLLVLRNEDDPVVDLIVRRGFPAVFFFCRHSDPTVPFVDADNVLGASLATEHLVELGHKRIGVVCGDVRARSTRDRLEGFQSVLGKNGLQLLPEDFLSIDSGSDYSQVHSYLSRPSLPTAIFCFSDLFAFQILQASSELDINVPSELSVVGFDSVPACERSSPPLTSVRQPVREIASTAVEMLSQMIQKGALESRHVVFPTTLELRASTASPRQA